MTRDEWLALGDMCEKATGPDDFAVIADTTKAIMCAIGYEMREGMYFTQGNGGDWFVDGNRIMVNISAPTSPESP